jgi:gas vesicle protein
MASTKDGSSSGTATVTEEVRQSTEQLKQTAQQKAGEMTEQTKQQATSLAEGQKSQATQNLDSISGALRSTEQQLHSDGQKVAAQAVTMAASQVEKLSGYLQSHSVSEMAACGLPGRGLCSRFRAVALPQEHTFSRIQP